MLCSLLKRCVFIGKVSLNLFNMTTGIRCLPACRLGSIRSNKRSGHFYTNKMAGVLKDYLNFKNSTFVVIITGIIHQTINTRTRYIMHR